MSGEALGGRFDAIVIGASAGGVDALGMVLPALQPGLQAAVFVVLHQTRTRPSLLTEIFQRRCALAVQEAQDKEQVQPGTVYFAPPDYHLLLDRGLVDDAPQLALSVDDPVEYSRPSIDVLFESAADVYGRRLLGMILTGSNEDGAAGLLAVHRNGGTTIVQQPDEAQMPYMPAAAMKRHTPDYVLSLQQIAALLRSLDATVAS